jgi:ubiquinone/menaquinone biosynthesis C-methylase UbiE
MIKEIVKKYLKKKSFAGTNNESNRLLWLEAALKKIPAGSRILDAGAGELAQKKYCSHLNYVSQDFAQYDGKGDNKGLQTKEWDNSKLDIVSDITNIPQPDKSFDAIMCIEVFEHIPDPLSAIKEFSRLLRPGGYFIVTAPFCSITHFAPYHFSTGFSRYFYEKHLPENGFKILEIDLNGNYFEFLAQELQRVQYCAEKYTGSGISLIDKMAVAKSIFMLNKLSKKDTGSNELLSYGLHVFCQKQLPG